MSVSPQFLDELRSRTLLSALVGRTLKLTKAGREFKGCCPFHNEKTPSFYVNDDKGFFHCFGCSAHGDAIRWMTDQRGLGFMDAVKELAQSAGMEVPAADPRAAERAERANSLYDVMTAAADWFVEQLSGVEGTEAKAYLERRGLLPETVHEFGIGYAPDSRRKLKSALAKFGEDKLIEGGLLIQVEEKESYDRFRGRLMIPIRDPRGRVIAFGGRILGTGEPKYINSPDTPLFDKGRTLYNMDRASAHARKSGKIVAVEGYLDVIAMSQAGIGDVVAPLGTSITETQIELLWRHSNVPILCLDGDSAGQKAALRAAQRTLPLLRPGFSLKFVTLPDGRDPADFVESGAGAALQQVLATGGKELSQVVWEAEVLASSPNTPETRAGLRQRLEELSSTIKNELVRQEYRSALNSLFWETFGWRKRETGAARDVMAALRQRPPSNLVDAIVRAVLLGVSRYHEVLRDQTEQIAMLHIGNTFLRQWRDILVDAVYDRPDLDESLIDTILAEADLDPVEKRDLTKDLAFSFFRPRNNDDRPIRELKEVIGTLRAEREIEIGLAEASARFKAATENDEWEQQQRLLSQQEDNRRKLREFGEFFEDSELASQRMTG